MKTSTALSTEMESFISAISDLFWGSKWPDIRGIAEQTWADFNRSGTPWEEVESQIENGWIRSARDGVHLEDRLSLSSLEQLDLFYKLGRIQRREATPEDVLHVGLRGDGLIDSCEPPNLTDAGREMHQSLATLAQTAVLRINGRARSRSALDR